MKAWKFLLTIALALSLFPAPSFAARATPFKGWYEILSQTEAAPATREWFLIDPDSLGNLWARYAKGPLPADLEKYRNDPALLAGFTNRELLFFGLEAGAVIGNGYMMVHGRPDESFEIQRRPEGTFDMVTTEGTRITRYLLSAPHENPESN